MKSQTASLFLVEPRKANSGVRITMVDWHEPDFFDLRQKSIFTYANWEGDRKAPGKFYFTGRDDFRKEFLC